MNHDADKSTTPQESEEVTNDVTSETQAAEHQPSQEQPSSEPHQTEQKTAQEQSSSEPPKTESADDVNTEKTWHNKNALKRGIAMLGFGFIAGFVRLGITLIAIFQFFSLLFAEKPNLPLVKFGQNLNTYLYQINQFLTVNSEMYPFPFAEWPDSAPK